MQTIIHLLPAVLGIILFGYTAQLEDVQEDCVKVKAYVRKTQKGPMGENYITFRYEYSGDTYEYTEKTFLPFIKEGMSAMLRIRRDDPGLCIPITNRVKVSCLYTISVVLFMAGLVSTIRWLS